MDTENFIRQLIVLPDYRQQIVHTEKITPRRAKFAEPAAPIAEAVRDCLKNKGFLPLYTHQAAALDRVRAGENIIVSTSSASGKTLCYNIPVAEALSAGLHDCAIYLFPTKALAQDQLRKFRELFEPALFDSSDVSTFDGDTPAAERGSIRKSARIIITNPDMLHVGILPNHQNWSRLLRHLRFIVIDEAHAYRGVFGSHVSLVLRRLRRLCALYGSKPQFICCSATIANPGEHAAALTGLPFSVISEDGSPRGGKDFIFWNPPIIDEAKSMRRSANSEATDLFTSLVVRNIRTLVFTRTRRLTELIYNYARQRLLLATPDIAGRIMPYRAGYLARDRRVIERQFFNGELIGLVATNALELGVDIGDLDATVLTGYPGSIASTWQQAGRSGRRRERSISFLIGTDNPLDQYLMNHPDAFFNKSVEFALINPANRYILRGHLLSAAWELPLGETDALFFGDTYKERITELVIENLLRERRGRWYLSPHISFPAQSINIRATSGEDFSLIDGASGALLETVEKNTAIFQLHPGAIYLHQGDSYLISKLDLVARLAHAAKVNADYYTQTREITDLRILNELKITNIGLVEVCLGEVEVSTTVIGFKKKAHFTEEVISEEPLDMPTQHFQTVAFWFDLPPVVMAAISMAQLDLAGGLHAAEHASISMLPLFALCDRNDIGGVSTVFHPDTGKAQIFIYDGHPGGIGIAEKGFELVAQLWETTLKVVSECPCESGCPSCVQSPKCGNNNKPLDKAAAKLILERLLEGRAAKE